MTVSTSVSPLTRLRAHVAIARPDHWFKNAFMVLGVLLAISYQPGALTSAGDAGRLLLAIAATCLVASRISLRT